MVRAGESRAETSLRYIDQVFELLLIAFQDNFRYYLRNSRKHANAPPILAVEVSIFLQSVDDYPFPTH